MDNIEKFWSSFLEKKNELIKQKPSQDSMDSLLESLEKIDDKLYYHIGLKDNSADLILSAEGNPELLETLSLIIQQSPKVTGWGFISTYDGLFLFGERNKRLYPENENGDALYRMVCSGDKPWIKRPVDFNLVFPFKKEAEAFKEKIQTDEFDIEVKPYTGAEGFTFEVLIKKNMYPNIREINSFEKILSNIASEFAGRNDGWGCFNAEEIND